MPQKKLLVFHPALAPYRIDFFNALHAHFEAKFYFFHTNLLTQKFNQEQLTGELTFKPEYLKQGADIRGWLLRTGILSIIHTFQPDIILVSEYSPATILVCFYKHLFKKKFKLFSIVDSSLDNAISRKGLRKFARKLVSSRIDGIIFANEPAAAWYKNNVNSKTVILEMPIIREDNLFRQKIRAGMPEALQNITHYQLSGKKIILYVGRLSREKNIPALIKAYSEMEEEDTRLVIVGGGSMEEELKNLADNLGIRDKVIFTGRKEGVELYAWYATGQIFVLPSIHEPFGAVINEALLSGCFVLVSKLAGASALVQNGNGYIFDPYNREELKKALTDALSKVEGIKPEEVNRLRENKMPFTFQNKIASLIKDISKSTE